jgi:hypothetical protein
VKETVSWFARAKAEADKGVPRNERVFGIGLVVFSVLMLLYFVAHQAWSTGFYTEKFGALEMIMLYGFWAFWITTAGLEGVLGLRLLSRIFDAFGGGVFITISLAWLLVVFPFEFTHFADVMPESLRFIVQWISNDVARALMAIGVIVFAGLVIYMPIGYKFVEIERFKRKDLTESEMAPNATDFESDQEEE